MIKATGPQAFTIRVGSGVVRKKCDQELKKQGLTLRLYPGRYTVNHWLHDERGNIRLRSRWMIVNRYRIG
jgi:hypothetical protein